MTLTVPLIEPVSELHPVLLDGTATRQIRFGEIKSLSQPQTDHVRPPTRMLLLQPKTDKSYRAGEAAHRSVGWFSWPLPFQGPAPLLLESAPPLAHTFE